MVKIVIFYFNRGRIVTLLQQGLLQNKVAEIVGLNQSDISKINKKFPETNDVQCRPGKGWKKFTTAAQDRQLLIIYIIACT